MGPSDPERKLTVDLPISVPINQIVAHMKVGSSYRSFRRSQYHKIIHKKIQIIFQQKRHLENHYIPLLSLGNVEKQFTTSFLSSSAFLFSA